MTTTDDPNAGRLADLVAAGKDQRQRVRLEGRRAARQGRPPNVVLHPALREVPTVAAFGNAANVWAVTEEGWIAVYTRVRPGTALLIDLNRPCIGPHGETCESYEVPARCTVRTARGIVLRVLGKLPVSAITVARLQEATDAAEAVSHDLGRVVDRLTGEITGRATEAGWLKSDPWLWPGDGDRPDPSDPGTDDDPEPSAVLAA
jgi:hypothetical protein